MDTMTTTSTAAEPVLVDVPLGSPTRPRWRGRVHLLALWAAVPSLVVLVLLADGAGRAPAPSSTASGCAPCSPCR